MWGNSDNSNVYIIEGCFSFKNLGWLTSNIKVWVNCPKNICYERLCGRESTDRKEIDTKLIKLANKKWQDSEDKYIANFNPESKADFVIDTK